MKSRDRSPHPSMGRTAGSFFAPFNLALALAAATTSQALSQPLYVYKHDSPRLYAFMGAHGVILTPHTYSPGDPAISGLVTFPPDVYWSHPYTATQSFGPPHDTVDISATLTHIIAPHGEPPNPRSFAYSFHINAGALPLGAGGAGINGTGWVGERRAAFSHPSLGHADKFWAGARYWVWDGPHPGNDILAYLWLVVGRHTDSEPGQQSGGPLFTLGDDASRQSAVGGLATVLYDVNTARADICVLVTGIRRDRLLGSHIHLGSPPTQGENVGINGGQVLYNLGGGQDWIEIGPALGRIVTEAGLSPLAVQALQEGSAYVDLHTVDFPQGDVFGVLDSFAEPDFRRGDANCDGTLSAADAEAILSFLNGFAPLCSRDAADADDDGEVSVVDAVRILAYLQGREIPPPPPGPETCGPDPTPDDLSSSGYPDDACGSAGAEFRRSDANGDGRVDLSDVIFSLGCLFRGSACPECQDAADANDDGRIDLSDPIFGLDFMFRGGFPPPPPGPYQCGPDPTDDELRDCEAPQLCGPPDR